MMMTNGEIDDSWGRESRDVKEREDVADKKDNERKLEEDRSAN